MLFLEDDPPFLFESWSLKTGDMLILAGRGWVRLSWSSDHHRHDKWGSLIFVWFFRVGLALFDGLWVANVKITLASRYPDLKKRNQEVSRHKVNKSHQQKANLRKKLERQSPVVTSPPKITTLTISSPVKFGVDHSRNHGLTYHWCNLFHLRFCL